MKINHTYLAVWIDQVNGKRNRTHFLYEWNGSLVGVLLDKFYRRVVILEN
jgi:hypothetical protein